MDKLDNIFVIQKLFTEKFFSRKYNLAVDDIRKNDSDLTKWNKEYILSLIVEATEILNECNWKMHHSKDDLPINDNILEEGVDVLKYLLGLLFINGFTIDDIYNKFIEKSNVVEAKFKQEEILNNLKNNKDAKIVFVDIDGVLASWPKTYINFVNKKFNTNYNTLKNIENNLDKRELYTTKQEYRLSGIKSNMDVLEGAHLFLEKLKQFGYYIILLTARPYKKIFRIYSDTLEWLKKNNLYFDAILWDEEKEKYIIEHFNIDNVVFCIDDSIENINKLSAKGFNSYLINNELTFDNNKDMQKSLEIKLNKSVKDFDNLYKLTNHLVKEGLV